MPNLNNGNTGFQPNGGTAQGPASGDALALAIQTLDLISSEAAQAAKTASGKPPPAPGGRPFIAMAGPAPAPAGVAAAPMPSGPAASGARMNPGEVLLPGRSLFSANGNYQLAMQTDGNLVLYSGASALWASNTAGKPVVTCIMQADGNLVLYNSAGSPLWNSETSGKPGAYLIVQDDGNVVIYGPNGASAWATNTVHTVGADTLIYRARLKRWTDTAFFGAKGSDVILVKLPNGATLKSVYIGPVDANGINPGLNSPVGASVGDSNSGARIARIESGPGFVAIGTDWWFNAFSDAEYSISVWVTGPTAYPVEDNGTLTSANVDGPIVAQIGKWLENNGPALIAAGTAIATACIDLASLGTATPVTTPILIAAILSAIAAGSKIALTPTN